MQKDRASQKERESEGQRQREKRTVYKTQQTKGKNKQNRRVGKKKEMEMFRENGSNRNNGTGEVRQERRENSAVISR